MPEIYYDNDTNLDLLAGKKIAILGFGSQGHAHAGNLRDSGLDVVVGLPPKSASRERAEKDGHQVLDTAQAAQAGDIIMVLIPDEKQKRAYDEEISKGLRAGKALAFAHGFNIHFKQIVPPRDVDVFLVAPKGPGHLVRRVYREGGGVPCLLAVHQDASGRAKETALAYSKGIGGTRAGVIETTFKEETETDLFGEQVVLCGGLTELVRAGFDTLVEAGYQPEIAYFECLHELKLIVDLMYEGGIKYMRYSVSDTAQFGDMTRGRRVINQQVREEMKKILAEVQSGQFAREWIQENENQREVFNALTRKDEEHLIEQVGEKLRSMMRWIGKK